MPQDRALATRQTIIDAAVDLFAANGYGETSLSDIAKRAEVTTGAFYYHFRSKKSVADAIIEQGWPRAIRILDQTLEPRGPGLEKIIAMTFEISALLEHDRVARVSNALNQAFGELSAEGRAGYRARAQTFIARVAASLQRSDLRDDVTPEEVGSLVWINVHGCLLLSDAMADNVCSRLGLSWKVLLASVAPEESQDYFAHFLKRTLSQYH